MFSTPPLERDLEVTGFVSVDVYASSSAKDTDFTALLADVGPTGYARFLTDGVVRARYRNNPDRPEEIVPGHVYKYTIDLWATSNVFKSGHRIRLYLSSSNFPRFNRNPNTGEPMLGSSRSVVARQTIYHDGNNASALILPVIPLRARASLAPASSPVLIGNRRRGLSLRSNAARAGAPVAAGMPALPVRLGSGLPVRARPGRRGRAPRVTENFQKENFLQSMVGGAITRAVKVSIERKLTDRPMIFAGFRPRQPAKPVKYSTFRTAH